MFEHSLGGLGPLGRAAQHNEIGKRSGRQFADRSGPGQGPGATGGGHPQNGRGREPTLAIGQQAHFFEHVQFDILATGLEYAGEAVSAKAYIHTRA
jgi:hypothetical protein